MCDCGTAEHMEHQAAAWRPFYWVRLLSLQHTYIAGMSGFHTAPALTTSFTASLAPCTALCLVLCMQSSVDNLQERLVRWWQECCSSWQPHVLPCPSRM